VAGPAELLVTSP